jgi:hypothetical protein
VVLGLSYIFFHADSMIRHGYTHPRLRHLCDWHAYILGLAVVLFIISTPDNAFAGADGAAAAMYMMGRIMLGGMVIAVFGFIGLVQLYARRWRFGSLCLLIAVIGFFYGFFYLLFPF